MSKIYTVAAALLAKAQASMDDEPLRAYVNPGSDVAHECDQLTVTLKRLAPSGKFPTEVSRHARMGVLPQATWWVELVRCTPVQEDQITPHPDDLQASAQEIMDDAWEMFSYFVNQIRAGSLLPEGCELVAPISLETTGPSGGLAGCRLVLITTISGV